MFPGPFSFSGSLWMAVLYQLPFQAVISHKSDGGGSCLLLQPLPKQELKRICANIGYQGTPFITSPLYPLNLMAQAVFYSCGSPSIWMTQTGCKDAVGAHDKSLQKFKVEKFYCSSLMQRSNHFIIGGNQACCA